MSLVEATTNVIVGFVLAVATQAILFPHLGLYVENAVNLVIATAFTAVSIVRTFLLRRLFESLRTKNFEGAYWCALLRSGVEWICSRK